SMSDAFDDESHLELYGTLMARHRSTFAAHTPALWQRRQEDLARVRHDLDQLELEWRLWLGPLREDRHAKAAALRSLADDAAAVSRAGELAADLERARHELAHSEAERARWREAAERGAADLERSQRQHHLSNEEVL